MACSGTALIFFFFLHFGAFVFNLSHIGIEDLNSKTTGLPSRLQLQDLMVTGMLLRHMASQPISHDAWLIKVKTVPENRIMLLTICL
jgi:hypothetical protein